MVRPHNNFQNDAGMIYQEKLDRMSVDDVYSMNMLTVPEKLEAALEFARSISEMHGFDTGPVMIGDVSLKQWLKTSDGRIILNDMDNSEILAYSESQGYCPVWSGAVGGLLSPEEIPFGNLNETTDVFKFGSLVFTILTGLDPYYDTIRRHKEVDVPPKVKAGEQPFIDPRYRTRSVIENRLVEVMDECHHLQPEKRPSIFDVVQYLEETQRRHTAGESLPQKSFNNSDTSEISPNNELMTITYGNTTATKVADTSPDVHS